MAMKQWSNQPVDFEELTIPIVKAIKFAYSLKRKNQDKDIPYKGYDTPSMNHAILNPEQAFKAESLEFALNDQGREALEVIVSRAVQLGIEQGIRLTKTRIKHNLVMHNIIQGAGSKALSELDQDLILKGLS